MPTHCSETYNCTCCSSSIVVSLSCLSSGCSSKATMCSPGTKRPCKISHEWWGTKLWPQQRDWPKDDGKIIKPHSSSSSAQVWKNLWPNWPKHVWDKVQLHICVLAYVCVRVCVCVCVCFCVCLCVSVRMCVWCVQVYFCVYLCVSVCVCVSVRKCVSVYVRVWACVCVCVWVCVYVCACAYFWN